MWVTSWYCKHHEHRLHVNLDSQGKIEPRHLAQTLCWCLWAFRVFFSLVVWGFFASPSAHQKVLWNLFEHQMLGILYFPYNDWRQPRSLVENYAKQNLSAYVWWMQFYLPFSITGKMMWMTLGNEWAEKADSSSRVSANLQSHAAVYAWALALPWGANQKSASDFTWFTCTLVVVRKSSSKLLTQSCTRCNPQEDHINMLDKVRGSHTVNCDSQGDEKRLCRRSHPLQGINHLYTRVI